MRLPWRVGLLCLAVYLVPARKAAATDENPKGHEPSPTALSKQLLAGDSPALFCALGSGRGRLEAPGGPLGPGGGKAAPRDGEPVQRVAFADLLEAMRAERRYDARRATNLARFQAGVILRLTGQAKARRPHGPPLFFDHAEWFRAYLETVGLTADRAPVGSRLSAENYQDAWVEYRTDRVVRKASTRIPVRLALNVRVAPLPQVSVPLRYSYDDVASEPRLRVTVERAYRYRLVDLGDQVVFDEIQGLHGRPTSGLLGALFSLIGEGHAIYSRMAVASDGIQIMVGQAKKAFLVRTATVTIQPDGTATGGLPRGRPDLGALEKRLREPLGIEYVPWADP
jgi:hypothetical protein